MAESSNTATSRRNRVKGEKHVWTAIEDAALVECLLRLVETGRWKADNGQFRNGYLTQLQTWMHEKLPGTQIQGNPHIESRTKLWKRQYNAIMLMLSDKASGFGWNDDLKCITCERQVYEDWCKSHNTAVGLRNKPFPYLEQFKDIFGTDQATGRGSEFAQESVEHLTKETAVASKNVAETDDELEEEDADDNRAANVTANLSNAANQAVTNNTATSENEQSQSNHTRRLKRKRSFGNEANDDEFTGTVDRIGGWIEKASENMSKLAGCFQFLANDAEAKKQVAAEMNKIDGLSAREKIKAGGIIASDSNKVNYFFTLSDDGKKEYVDLVLEGCME